jgi:hypothetical protein
LIGITPEDLRKALDQEDWVEVEPDREERLLYIGTVFSLSPSGKYYMPWACSNVTEEEALQDEEWRDALEFALGEYDLWITCGEGDPCDLFVGECRDVEED